MKLKMVLKCFQTFTSEGNLQLVDVLQEQFLLVFSHLK